MDLRCKTEWVGYGQSSSDEMADAFVRYIELSDEDFKRMQEERTARAQARKSAN